MEVRKRLIRDAALLIRTRLTGFSSTSLPEIAHSLIQDDSFEGYNLPAGTNVIWNSWGVHMGASEYEQPERFWPERFLNEDVDKALKGHLAFGAGRSRHRFNPWVTKTNGFRQAAEYVPGGLSPTAALTC